MVADIERGLNKWRDESEYSSCLPARTGIKECVNLLSSFSFFLSCFVFSCHSGLIQIHFRCESTTYLSDELYFLKEPFVQCELNGIYFEIYNT